MHACTTLRRFERLVQKDDLANVASDKPVPTRCFSGVFDESPSIFMARINGCVSQIAPRVSTPRPIDLYGAWPSILWEAIP